MIVIKYLEINQILVLRVDMSLLEPNRKKIII